MNESWHIWMSHGTYEWVMVHMNESWHIWMSHGTYEWVMAHTNESWHIWMTLLRFTHDILLNESQWAKYHFTYEWPSRHIWMSHGTFNYSLTFHTYDIRLNESHWPKYHFTYEWVFPSHIDMDSQSFAEWVSHMLQCLTFHIWLLAQWVSSTHVWISLF